MHVKLTWSGYESTYLENRRPNEEIFEYDFVLQ